MAEEPANEHGFTEVSEQQPPPQPKSSVLRLRGLPFSAGEEDVRHFFSGFNVAQVVIGKRAGRSTGEGYVQLDSTSAAAEAIMKLHRQTLGHRYIEVFESTEADLATAKSLSVDRMRGFVVRCRGLPYTATAQDVLNFFGSDAPVVRGIEGVVFTYAPDGRPTGEAFVEFQTEDAQREALKKHKESMGARYIELFVSTKVDMIQAIQQNRLILGYSNRKRWLQQQGINLAPGPAPGHMHPHMQPQHQNHYGPQQHHGPRRHPQYGQVEEVTEMMSGAFPSTAMAGRRGRGGFNMGGMGGHAVQVIGPGGQMLPSGTYQLEVPREGGGKQQQQQQQQQQQRFGFPGRGGGRGGARGPGPAAFPGRGPAGGMVMGGRGMQQFGPARPPPQVMAMAPMPPAARQTAQVVPVAAAAGAGNGGQTVIMQEVPQQAGAQYIQYEQQQWGQQVIVQQPQQQGATQQQSPLYTTGASSQQGTAIQGVAPGTYTLTTSVIQVPSGAGGGAGGYSDYQQQVHSLQGLDGSAGTGGLQPTWGPR